VTLKTSKDTNVLGHKFEYTLCVTDSPQNYDDTGSVDSGSPYSIETDIKSNNSNRWSEKGDGGSLADDQDYSGPVQGSENNQRPKGPPKNGGTNHESKKRNYGIAFSDGADLEDCRQPVTDRRKKSSEQDSKPPFACPFYKLDIQQHQKCLRYQLRRIKDVKQHITRQHSQPEFYCARCYDVFGDATQRDAHARRATCEVHASAPDFDGVSAEQRRQLSLQYVNRGKPAAAQWHSIWDILFPGRPHPGSAYVGDYVEEVTQLLQTVWRSKAPEIISRVSPAAGTRGGDGNWCAQGLTQVVESLLSQLVTTSSPHAVAGTPMAYTTSTASTASSSTTLPGSIHGCNQNNGGSQGNPDDCYDVLPPFDYEDHSSVVAPFGWETRDVDIQETDDLSFEGLGSGCLNSDLQFHAEYNWKLYGVE
jgi:hypothetical protein